MIYKFEQHMIDQFNKRYKTIVLNGERYTPNDRIHDYIIDKNVLDFIVKWVVIDDINTTDGNLYIIHDRITGDIYNNNIALYNLKKYKEKAINILNTIS